MSWLDLSCRNSKRIFQVISVSRDLIFGLLMFVVERNCAHLYVLQIEMPSLTLDASMRGKFLHESNNLTSLNRFTTLPSDCKSINSIYTSLEAVAISVVNVGENTLSIIELDRMSWNRVLNVHWRVLNAKQYLSVFTGAHCFKPGKIAKFRSLTYRFPMFSFGTFSANFLESF